MTDFEWKLWFPLKEKQLQNRVEPGVKKESVVAVSLSQPLAKLIPRITQYK